MTQRITASRPVSRRQARNPRMIARLKGEVARVADDVHRRRLTAWAQSGVGDYPTLEVSLQIAARELALLADAIGALVEIEPRRFDADVRAMRQERRE